MATTRKNKKSSSIKNLGFSSSLKMVPVSQSFSSANKRRYDLNNDDWIRGEIKKQKDYVHKIKSTMNTLAVKTTLQNEVNQKVKTLVAELEKAGVDEKVINDVIVHLQEVKGNGMEDDQIMKTIKNHRLYFEKNTGNYGLTFRATWIFMAVVTFLIVSAATAGVPINILQKYDKNKDKRKTLRKKRNLKGFKILGDDYSYSRNTSSKEKSKQHKEEMKIAKKYNKNWNFDLQ